MPLVRPTSSYDTLVYVGIHYLTRSFIVPRMVELTSPSSIRVNSGRAWLINYRDNFMLVNLFYRKLGRERRQLKSLVPYQQKAYASRFTFRPEMGLRKHKLREEEGRELTPHRQCDQIFIQRQVTISAPHNVACILAYSASRRMWSLHITAFSCESKLPGWTHTTQAQQTWRELKLPLWLIKHHIKKS
jgi:hypothetical protein